MHVKLQWVTPGAEQQIAYIARGSNPANQENPEYEKLFRYCLKNGHWSPFQMASMCLHFETSLAVANQVKRHWSFSICEPADVQETSMRYMDPLEEGWHFQPVSLRLQGKTNRQVSGDSLQGQNLLKANELVGATLNYIRSAAEVLQELGVANECVRMLYPQATTTRFFISGSARSWIHYFDQRVSPHAQNEHVEIALRARAIFSEFFPTISKILWEDESGS